MRAKTVLVKLYLLFCLICTVNSSAAEVYKSPSLKNLPALDALIQKHHLGRINHIVQDHLGFIWLAGANGLARYNGHELNVYRHQEGNQNSLADNQINALLMDREGRLWVATFGGLARFNSTSDEFEAVELPEGSTNVSCLTEDRLNHVVACTQRHIIFIDKTHAEINHYAIPHVSGSDIQAVLVDRFNRLWFSRDYQQLGLFDIDSRQFIRLPEAVRNNSNISNTAITQIFENQSGSIWFATQNGMVEFDENSETLKSVPFLSAQGPVWVSVQVIAEGLYGEILVGTRKNGVWLYEADSATFKPISQNLGSPKKIKALYHDRSGNLWLSEFSGEIYYKDINTTQFSTIKIPSTSEESFFEELYFFYKSINGQFWLGSGAGLFAWFPDSEHLKPFTLSNQVAEKLAVQGIAQMTEGVLWLLVNGNNILEMDVSNGEVLALVDSNKFNNEDLQQILFDAKGDLWLVSKTIGLYKYNPSTQDVENYSESTVFHQLYLDVDGVLWAASSIGLLRFDEQADRFVSPAWASDEALLSSQICCFYDVDGLFWIGTKQKGLLVYDKRKKELKSIDMSNGLVSNFVASLQADAQGYIWVATDLGFTKVNPQTLVLDSRINERGFGGNFFDRNISAKDDKGRLYFGGMEGISVFHPSDFVRRMDHSPLVIPRVLIERQEGPYSLSYSNMSLSTLGRNEIVLDHKDRAFTVEFALLDFRAPQKNRYVYRLEGFDDKWHFVGNRNYATYTNLDAGKYTFKVKAANTDGLWSAQASEIGIRVKPQFWLSPLAYGVYACVLVSFLILLWKSQVKRVDFVKEQKLNDRLRRVERIKDAILANTSLEIRTPLNNIVGLSESLADGVAGEVSIAAKDYLKRIVESSRHLTNLVDNILEYSTLIGSEAVLIKKPMDLNALVQSVLASYYKKAKEKDIQLQNLLSDALPLIYADEARMQQILMNLVENAIAHSHSGTVSVGCRELHETIELFVEDCGVGITKEQQAFLFDPFYVGENENNRPVSGIGLGLAVTKHLVEMHGGSISVESTPGEGSTFTVILPLSEGVKLASREVAQTHMWNANLVSGPKPENLVEGDYVCGLENTEAYTILVVDDDAINRMVITGMLSQCRYNTLEAASGEDALKVLAKEDNSIDLVIMDVVLPRMSGFETCQKIRERFGFYELPVIFLTAKKVSKSAMEGFCVGGNEFLFKPITKYELLPRLANLLKLSETSRQQKKKKIYDT